MSVEETMALTIFRAEIEALYARMWVSRTLLTNARFDIVRSEAQQVVMSMRTWLAAKSHKEDWLDHDEEVVAPGVRNNIHAALNRHWPFKDRPLHVETLMLEQHRHHKTTYVCPHLDVPDMRSDHVTFLMQADGMT